ncbi:hypothetical protein BC628DRAFT_215098 [Trametes gibbosa]|nr:hypothetical protein BC628DRAFT_215098 [Trametes gibbosa]
MYRGAPPQVVSRRAGDDAQSYYYYRTGFLSTLPFQATPYLSTFIEEDGVARARWELLRPPSSAAAWANDGMRRHYLKRERDAVAACPATRRPRGRWPVALARDPRSAQRSLSKRSESVRSCSRHCVVASYAAGTMSPGGEWHAYHHAGGRCDAIGGIVWARAQRF